MPERSKLQLQEDRAAYRKKFVGCITRHMELIRYGLDFH